MNWCKLLYANLSIFYSIVATSWIEFCSVRTSYMLNTWVVNRFFFWAAFAWLFIDTLPAYYMFNIFSSFFGKPVHLWIQFLLVNVVIVVLHHKIFILTNSDVIFFFKFVVIFVKPYILIFVYDRLYCNLLNLIPSILLRPFTFNRISKLVFKLLQI